MAEGFEHIGQANVYVSPLGLGGTGLSGGAGTTQASQGDLDDEAMRLITRSLALGVSYFDTAPMYGLGESERRYANALSSIPRDEFVISTKVGRLLAKDRHAVASRWHFDFSRQGIRRSLEESLERLGLEYIDIAFIHDPDGDVMFDETSPGYYQEALTEALPELHRLKSEGLIKAVGVGMNQWEMELRFAKEAELDCFLLAGRYTLLDQSALAEFLPYCHEHRISVIAGGPYNSGILAAGPTQGATYNYRPAPPDILHRVRQISEICQRYYVPLKAAALQFIVAHPAVASVIPGAQSVEEGEDNVTMFKWTIPGALWSELKEAKLVSIDAPTPN
jgi:D-threo-aldose 1-dehydrogenase